MQKLTSGLGTENIQVSIQCSVTNGASTTSYLFPSGTIMEEGQEMDTRGQRALEQNSAFWNGQECQVHKLTVTVVVYTKLAQVQANQHSIMDGGGVYESLPLSEELFIVDDV